MATVNLTFNVYLPDRERVLELQAQFPNGWVHAPAAASTELAAELGYAVPLLNSYFPVTSPCVQTAWNRAEAESDQKFPTDVAVFRIGSDSFWGGLFGSNTRYIWLGRFHYMPLPTEAGIPTEGAPEGYPVDYYPIPLRKWIDGMEAGSAQLGQLEGSTALGTPTRAASRTSDGYGLSVRTAVGSRSHAEADFAFPASSNGWETFYVKLRRAPTAAVRVWQVTTIGGTGAAAIIAYMNIGGVLAFYSVDSASAETLAFTTDALPIDETVRVDVFYKLSMTNPGPLFNTWFRLTDYKVWVNGVEVGGVTGFTHSTHFGAVVALTCGTSALGTIATTGAMECDFNDWRGAACPDRIFGTTTWSSNGPLGAGGDYSVGNEVTHDVDGDGVLRVYRASAISGAVAGSHEPGTVDGADYWTQMLGPYDLFIGFTVRHIEPREFSPDHDAVAWPGDIRTLQRRTHGATSSPFMSSTTSGGVLEVELAADFPLALGAGAVVVGVHGAGAGTSTLGAGIAGAAVSSAAVAQDGTQKWCPRLFNVDGVITAPRVIHPLVVRYTKDASATQRDLSGIGAVVEYFGIFEPCDLWDEPGVADPLEAPATPIPPGLHNAPFPHSPHAQLTGSPAFGGVWVKTGTYVGNAVGQDLEFDWQPHLLIIRPVTSPAGGQKWWSSMLRGAHVLGNGAPDPAGVVVVEQDLAYESAGGAGDAEERYRVRIPGNNSQVNANTVVYQYMVFSDPAARHLLCGAVHHGTNALDASHDNALVNPTFTPVFGWLWAEFHNTGGDDTGTYRTWIKGPGNLLDTATILDGAEAATRFSFAEGVLTTKSGVHTSGSRQLAFALMRAVEPDEKSTGVVFQIRSYVGNGVSPREIPLLTPGLSGKRPLFAIVVPDDAAPWFRDCGHLTGMSSRLGAMGAPAANGITAGGIDTITVGSSCNANGVDYSVLVIPGSDTAGTDGWSICGEFMLKEPAEAADGPFEPPRFDDDDEDPEDEDLDAGDDDEDGDGTDLATGCAASSQEACNLALSRIGVSKQIADIVTDDTKEAALARLHITSDVNAVLARFPWEFARKYAALVLVDGEASAPVNGDWTFSYRRPSDCVFERRIVEARGAAVNPTPPAMALGRDTTGGLIFCNVEDAQLEYTTRGTCPARDGDTLFKEALIWKLAASFAPALSRIEGKAAACLEKYEETIASAYQVLRPGNPGPVQEVDADAFDQSATQTAANLSVANLALIRIGARTIPSLRADSREALSVRAIFEHELQAVLRDHAWAFATRYAELPLVAGAATWDEPLVQTWDITRSYEVNDAVVFNDTVYYALEDVPADPSGSDPSVDTANWTEDEPDEANGDWLRAYRIPETSVFARRLVKPGVRRTYDPDPSPFKLGTDDGGAVLYADVEQAILEFTARIDGAVARADALFRDAFAWRLAASLAPALAQIDPEETEQIGRGPDVTALPKKHPSVTASKAAARQRVAEWAMGKYLYALELAKVGISNERQDEPDGDAPWIAGR